MNKHTAIHDGFPMRRGLRQLVIHEWHVIGHNVVRLLQVHLTCEFFADLIQSFRGPVPKPIQHTPEEDARTSAQPPGEGGPGEGNRLLRPRAERGPAYRLKSAGEVAARSLSPSEDGFMVKTTCRLRMTWLVNHRYSSSCESSIRPSFCAPSLHCVIKVAYSSPSKRPGT